MIRFVNERFIIRGNKFWIRSTNASDCWLCPLCDLCSKDFKFFDSFGCFGEWEIAPI